MTKEQALQAIKLLDQVAAQANLPRAVHQEVVSAINGLTEYVNPKDKEKKS